MYHHDVPAYGVWLDQRCREYYDLIVNKRTHNMLNWMLIVLMAILPLRNAAAFEQVNCQMHEQSSIEMSDHDMHAMHGMSHMDSSGDTAAAPDDCCCCDNSMSCNGDCGVGLGASFIVQSAITVPAISGTTCRTHINATLVLRDVSPPIRPPQNFQI